MIAHVFARKGIPKRLIGLTTKMFDNIRHKAFKTVNVTCKVDTFFSVLNREICVFI